MNCCSKVYKVCTLIKTTITAKYLLNTMCQTLL